VADVPVDPAAFYAALPAKRMSAGLICRDDRGRILLVRPTYTTVWHVPGGAVETGESPRQAASREAREELGIDLHVGRLLVVDWMPGRPPATEGLMFLFDGGLLDESMGERFELPPEEIRGWAFVERAQIAARVTEVLGSQLAEALVALDLGETCYTEAGMPLERRR
jgi:8-oxo-dGTP diphosphatase